MKSRSTFGRRPSHYTSINRISGKTELDTWSNPYADYDQFTVGFDYTGPRPNPLVFHAHSFNGLRYSDFCGQEDQASSSSFITRTGKLFDFTHHGPPGSFGVPAPDWSGLYNEALGDVFDQLEPVTSVDLATDLGEAGQTVKAYKEYRDHLVSLADKLAKESGRLVRFIRRYHPKQWGRRFLEYQYGWKPLASDMYKTLQRIVNHVSYTVIRVSGQSQTKGVGRFKYAAGWPEGVTETVHTEWSFQQRIVAEFKLQQNLRTQLQGYTSLNPLTIAWELLPGSFIADWVFNVGGYLQLAERATTFAGMATSSYEVRRTLVTHAAGLGGGFNRINTWYAVGASASARRTSKYRGPTGLSPKVPSVSVNMGSSRLLSAASLLSLFVTDDTGPDKGPRRR